MSELRYKNFVKLSLPEKKLVLEWRNSDRVRLRMDSQEVITLEDHLRWIEGLTGRTDCVYCLVLLDSTPIGVVNYSITVANGQQQFTGGMHIGDEKFSGYGIVLSYYSLFRDFEIMNAMYVNDRVLKSNKRAYLMQKKFFHARDIAEDDKYFHIQYDREIWKVVRQELDAKIRTNFGITHVNWDA